MRGTLGRDVSLDALRGVAICSVVIFHYVSGDLPPQHLDGLRSVVLLLVSLGWAGVDLFFVLSGFLIGGILIDNREAGNLFGVFYVRRIARIIPLYVLAVGLVLLLTPMMRDPSVLAYFATFTQNFWMASLHEFHGGRLDVTWSLALEEQFDLLAPLAVRLIRPELLPRFLAGAIVLGPVCRAAVWLTFHPGYQWMAAYILLPCRIDTLAMGMLIAVAVRDPLLRAWLTRHRRSLLLAAACCITITIAMVADGQNWRGWPFSIAGFSLVSLACAGMLVFFVTERGGRAWRVLTTRLAPVGVGAYSIYLFHKYGSDLGHLLFDWSSAGPIARTTVLALFNVAVAYLLWHAIERPFIALGHRAKYRPAPLPAVAVGSIDAATLP